MGFLIVSNPGRLSTWRGCGFVTREPIHEGALFLQIRLPFWMGIQIRPFTKRYFQCGLGFKGNGRFAVLFRFQTDESSAAGMDYPNYNQATYMNDGGK